MLRLQSVVEMVDYNLNDETELDEETRAAFAVTKETVAPSWSVSSESVTVNVLVIWAPPDPSV